MRCIFFSPECSGGSSISSELEGESSFFVAGACRFLPRGLLFGSLCSVAQIRDTIQRNIPSQPSAMSLLLNCFIHGETLGLFVGKIEKTETIYTLKTMIKEKKAPLFNHLDVTDFDLWMVDPLYSLLSTLQLKHYWQVNKPVSAKPAKTLADRIGDLGELGQFATKLQEPTDSLLDIFSTQPSHDCIHIIVKKSLGTRILYLNPHSSPRLSLVDYP